MNETAVLAMNWQTEGTQTYSLNGCGDVQKAITFTEVKQGWKVWCGRYHSGGFQMSFSLLDEPQPGVDLIQEILRHCRAQEIVMRDDGFLAHELQTAAVCSQKFITLEKFMTVLDLFCQFDAQTKSTILAFLQ